MRRLTFEYHKTLYCGIDLAIADNYFSLLDLVGILIFECRFLLVQKIMEKKIKENQYLHVKMWTEFEGNDISLKKVNILRCYFKSFSIV